MADSNLPASSPREPGPPPRVDPSLHDLRVVLHSVPMAELLKELALRFDTPEPVRAALQVGSATGEPAPPELEQDLEHRAKFCEQTARDGIWPSPEWFTETAADLRKAADALSAVRSQQARIAEEQEPYDKQHLDGCRKLIYDRKSSPCTCRLEFDRLVMEFESAEATQARLTTERNKWFIECERLATGLIEQFEERAEKPAWSGDLKPEDAVDAAFALLDELEAAENKIRALDADRLSLREALEEIVYIGTAWLTPSADQCQAAMRQRAEAALQGSPKGAEK